MTADTREYDLFGPWVDEVRTRQEVPRLYRDHPIDFTATRLVLKVPRNISRRDATAEMDLYDHLVALEEDRVTILSRWQDGAPATTGPYRLRTMTYADIAALHDDVSLLDARLRIIARDGDVLTVPYNGSAAKNLRRLVDHLRLSAPQPVGTGARAGWSPDGPQLLDQLALGPADVGVVSAHSDIARTRPDLRALAWHGRRVVAPATRGLPGLLARLSHAFSPMTLHAAIVAADADSLEIFGRRDWLVRGRAPVHSTSRLIVLRSALDRVDVRPHPTYPEATTVAFVTGRAAPTVVVPTGSAAERALTALGAAPTGSSRR